NSINERIRPALEEKNISLQIDCDKSIIAHIDPERFQQVVINILHNSQQHSPTGTNILIELIETDKEIIIVIADEGEGIPKQDLPYIFDRLYRVDKSRSRESGGSGLGLSITKEIVESHGGTIDIESELGK